MGSDANADQLVHAHPSGVGVSSIVYRAAWITSNNRPLKGTK